MTGYSKEQQLGRNYHEILDRDNRGKRVRYVVGKCGECGEDYKKKHHGCRHKDVCALCAQKRGWKKHKGQTHDKVRKGKNKVCKSCGKEYYVIQYNLKTSKFCSRKCQFDWMKENPPAYLISDVDNTGKNNPAYKHGRDGGRGYKGDKRKAKEKLIERDGGKECLLCGKSGERLHLHRVVYGSQGGKYEADNCVQLCPKDHALVHSSKNTWLEILLDYLREPNRSNQEILIKKRVEILGGTLSDDWWMEQ